MSPSLDNCLDHFKAYNSSCFDRFQFSNIIVVKFYPQKRNCRAMRRSFWEAGQPRASIVPTQK